MLLFYIRHGDPIYNPDSLTPLGERQAEALAKRLALYGIDKVFVSTSERAKLTAKPTCDILRKTPTELDWANESYAWRDLARKYDEAGHTTWAFAIPAYRAKFNSPAVRALGREWYDHPDFADTAFASGMQRIQRETDAFIESLGYRHDLENNVYRPVSPNEDRIALFAHQGFGLAFLSCLLDVPYPQFCTHFDLGHSSMTVIEFRPWGDVITPQVLQLSSDSHLYREGLPTKYQNRIYF